jgi:hypothetical protein
MKPLKAGYFFEAIPFGILAGVLIAGIYQIFAQVIETGNLAAIGWNLLMAPLAIALAGIPALAVGFLPLLAGLYIYGLFMQNTAHGPSICVLPIPVLIISAMIIVPLRWFVHLEIADPSLWATLLGTLLAALAACWDFRRLYLGGDGIFAKGE